MHLSTKTVGVFDEHPQGRLVFYKDHAAVVASLKKLSVTNIMLEVVPGHNGMGEEVFAKSVSEVEQVLSKMSNQLEDYILGITVHPLLKEKLAAMEARVSELEAALNDCEKLILITGDLYKILPDKLRDKVSSLLATAKGSQVLSAQEDNAENNS